MTMPAQRPGKSEQAVKTQLEFVVAVQRRFGLIQWDLAADASNTLGEQGYYGPGSPDEDSLMAPWPIRALCWCNPPYGLIEPWARRCATQGAMGSRILLLVPASVGSRWFNLWVRPYAFVFELTPRLTFEGHQKPYPKDLVLAYFGPEGFVGREPWHWKGPKVKPVRVPANDNDAPAVDPRQLTLPEAPP